MNHVSPTPAPSHRARRSGKFAVPAAGIGVVAVAALLLLGGYFGLGNGGGKGDGGPGKGAEVSKPVPDKTTPPSTIGEDPRPEIEISVLADQSTLKFRFTEIQSNLQHQPQTATFSDIESLLAEFKRMGEKWRIANIKIKVTGSFNLTDADKLENRVQQAGFATEMSRTPVQD